MYHFHFISATDFTSKSSTVSQVITQCIYVEAREVLAVCKYFASHSRLKNQLLWPLKKKTTIKTTNHSEFICVGTATSRLCLWCLWAPLPQRFRQWHHADMHIGPRALWRLHTVFSSRRVTYCFAYRLTNGETYTCEHTKWSCAIIAVSSEKSFVVCIIFNMQVIWVFIRPQWAW